MIQSQVKRLYYHPLVQSWRLEDISATQMSKITTLAKSSSRTSIRRSAKYLMVSRASRIHSFKARVEPWQTRESDAKSIGSRAIENSPYRRITCSTKSIKDCTHMRVMTGLKCGIHTMTWDLSHSRSIASYRNFTLVRASKSSISRKMFQLQWLRLSMRINLFWKFLVGEAGMHNRWI